MSQFKQDTPVIIEEIQVELIRQMPPWRKIELVFELSDTVSALALLGIKNRFPRIEHPDLHRRYADLVWGEELAQTVYGDLEKG